MIKTVCLMEELSEIQQTKGKALCGWGGRKRKKKKWELDTWIHVWERREDNEQIPPEGEQRDRALIEKL